MQIRYIIQKHDGITEYYAGPSNTTARRFTSTASLATRYTNMQDANTMAEALERNNRDGKYIARQIQVLL